MLLVRGQDVDELIRDRITSVFELGLHRSFDRFVREQRGERDRIDRTVDLGDVGRGREGLGDDTNPSLASRRRVQDCGLEDDEWRRERLASSAFKEALARTSSIWISMAYD